MNSYYSDNRKAYSGVLESAAAHAKGWRNAFFIMLFITLTAVCGVVYIGSKSKIVPAVVEINGYGVPTRIYTVDETTTISDDRVTKAALANVVTGVRSVSADASYEKKMLEEMIYFFEKSSPGFVRVQEYLNNPETNPFKRASKELVDVQIDNIIKMTENTWQIEWRETVKERTGQIKSSMDFKAIVTLSKAEKISAASLYINPTGVLIKDIVWSQKLILKQKENYEK